MVVLRVTLRHITTEAVLAELRRNKGLRRLIGIEQKPAFPALEHPRFLDVLGRAASLATRRVFDEMIQRSGLAVADLGGYCR